MVSESSCCLDVVCLTLTQELGNSAHKHVSKGILVCMFQGFERGNKILSCWQNVWNVTLYFLVKIRAYLGWCAAPLTSRCCILCYSTNIRTEYFKHAAHTPFFFSSKCRLFHNATFFGSVLFTFYIQGVLKLKKKSGAKELKHLSMAQM